MRVFNTGANKPGLGRRKRKTEGSKEHVIENPLKLIETRVFNPDTGANKPGLGRRKRKTEGSKERVIENPLNLIENRQQK